MSLGINNYNNSYAFKGRTTKANANSTQTPISTKKAAVAGTIATGLLGVGILKGKGALKIAEAIGATAKEKMPELETGVKKLLGKLTGSANKAEELKKAEERARLEAQKKAEQEAWLKQYNAEIEARKKANEAKKAEEARIAQQKAQEQARLQAEKEAEIAREKELASQKAKEAETVERAQTTTNPIQPAKIALTPELEEIKRNSKGVWNKEFNVNGKNTKFQLWEGTRGGSNPGGLVQNMETGEVYYAKFGGKQSESEAFAAALYRLGGVDVPEITRFTMPDGESGVLSKYISDLRNVRSGKPEPVNDGFGMDAFLANWDAVCSHNTKIKDGKAIRTDAGGALTYRARGARKEFGGTVNELTTLVNPRINYESAVMFRTMDREALMKSLQKVVDIPDEALLKTAKEYGSDLGSVLVERKQYIGQFLDEVKTTPQDGKPLFDYMTAIKAKTDAKIAAKSSAPKETVSTVQKESEAVTTPIKEKTEEKIATKPVSNVPVDPLERYEELVAPIKEKLHYEENQAPFEGLKLNDEERKHLIASLKETGVNMPENADMNQIRLYWQEQYVYEPASLKLNDKKGERAILDAYPRYNQAVRTRRGFRRPDKTFKYEPVYREMHIKDEAEFLKQFEEGGEYVAPQLQSCSKNKYFGEFNEGEAKFTDWDPFYNVKFVIHPKGPVSKAADISASGPTMGGLEVIYPADSKFKVLGKVKKTVTPDEIQQYGGEPDINFDPFEKWEIHLQEM